MRPIRLLASLLLFWSLPALADPPEATLKGWSEVVDAVKNQPANAASGLNGREFTLELSPNASLLEITPMAPFELSGVGNKYTLKVVNAAALLINEGGLILKQPLNWTAKVGGGGDFKVQISGIDECLFNLTFRQKDGGLLNLSALRENYDVTWTFDRPSAIASSDINGGALQIRRNDGDNSDVSVVLRLKSKSSSTNVRSEPVSIQKCARFVRDDNNNPGVIQVRTPGQCVVQSRRKEDQYTAGSKRGINYETTYRNTCDQPISCVTSWRQFTYQSEADGIARIKGTEVSHWRKTLSMAANGEAREKFHLEASIGHPYYSWTNPWLPDSAYPGWNEPDLQCIWAK